MIVCVGILLYVVITMIVVSKVFSRKLAPVEERSGMIMELPPYHKAHWKHIIKEAFFKAWDIFKRALGTVTLVSVLFYVLSFSKDGNVDNSLLYRVGTFIEPVTRFFGMGWQTFMAFVSGAFAKEAVLGTLNAVFMGNNSLMEATFFAKTVPARFCHVIGDRTGRGACIHVCNDVQYPMPDGTFHDLQGISLPEMDIQGRTVLYLQCTGAVLHCISYCRSFHVILSKETGAMTLRLR